MKLLILGVLLLAFTAGCSFEDEEPAPSTAPPQTTATKEPTRAEFIAAFDSWCEQADKRADDSSSGFDAAQDRQDTDEMARIYKVELAKDREQIDRLRALAVPQAEAGFMADYVAYSERTHSLIESITDAVEREDLSAAKGFEDEAVRVYERRDALVAGHGGFKHCGDEGQAP